MYAVENVTILHLPKHESVKSTHWSKVMSSLLAGLVKTARWRSADLQNPAQSAKGEERGDHERNPWLAKMRPTRLSRRSLCINRKYCINVDHYRRHLWNPLKNARSNPRIQSIT